MRTEIVYFSLGSNMGHSIEILLKAITVLDKSGQKVIDTSGIYLSEPVGYLEQSNFYNMVIAAETSNSPRKVLHKCQEIENQLGRVRKERWGPRKIDIDILFYNNHIINEKDLVLPHPRLKERAFVLVPLKEIAPYIFKELKTAIPPQKLCLKIEQTDVKMMLKEQGLVIE